MVVWYVGEACHTLLQEPLLTRLVVYHYSSHLPYHYETCARIKISQALMLTDNTSLHWAMWPSIKECIIFRREFQSYFDNLVNSAPLSHSLPHLPNTLCAYLLVVLPQQGCAVHRIRVEPHKLAEHRLQAHLLEPAAQE
jgi:hypothetical protein